MSYITVDIDVQDDPAKKERVTSLTFRTPDTEGPTLNDLDFILQAIAERKAVRAGYTKTNVLNLDLLTDLPEEARG